ncbi:MAG: hypothetical protein EAX96_14865 [Candidatus Lokiarchaeota archaeon]|nr:hypothetical protein [Candidatus Lokiarchaeota archaeon]
MHITNIIFYVFMGLLQVLQLIVFFTTMALVLVAAYYVIALLPWTGLEKEASSRKHLLFIAVALGSLIMLDAWFWATFGAPLFLREIMDANAPDWMQNITASTDNVSITSNPVQDIFTDILLPLLQTIFLFVIMVLLLVLFIFIFMYFSEVESQGKCKKMIFTVILALVVMMFVQGWFLQTFGADLLLRGFFS